MKNQPVKLSALSPSSPLSSSLSSDHHQQQRHHHHAVIIITTTTTIISITIITTAIITITVTVISITSPPPLSSPYRVKQVLAVHHQDPGSTYHFAAQCQLLIASIPLP